MSHPRTPLAPVGPGQAGAIQVPEDMLRAGSARFPRWAAAQRPVPDRPRGCGGTATILGFPHATPVRDGGAPHAPNAAPGEQATAEADAGPGHVPTRGRTGRGLIPLGG